MTDDDPPVPDDVQTNQSATNVNLYWYWPQTDGGDGITTFRVEVSKTGQWPSQRPLRPEAPTLDCPQHGLDWGCRHGPCRLSVPSMWQPAPLSATPPRTPQQFTHTDAAMTFLTQGKSLQYRVFADQWSGTPQPAFQRIVPEHCDVRQDPGDETRS